MILGIVGNGADKFTAVGIRAAKLAIEEIIESAARSHKGEIAICSGHSIMGGVDIWAEEAADSLGVLKIIKWPLTTSGQLEDRIHRSSWDAPYGYKNRNLDIVKESDVLHVVLSAKYPDNYVGQRFPFCYHCKKAGRDSTNHVKSGACYTANLMVSVGKPVEWHIVT